MKPFIHTLTVTILFYGACHSQPKEVGLQRELYVKSAPTQQCVRDSQCHSLLSYIERGNTTFISNTTLYFLPGDHSAVVPQPKTVIISNVKNLVLRGPDVGPNSLPNARIICDGALQFHIRNSRNIIIKDLAISNCGVATMEPHNITLFPFPAPCSTPKAALGFNNVYSMSLENLDIRHSYGYGLFAVNVFGNSSIIQCYFYKNYWGSHSEDTYDAALWAHGGNALVVIEGTKDDNEHYHSLKVADSIFSYGRKLNYLNIVHNCDDLNYENSCNFEMCTSAGLGVFVASHNTSQSSITEFHISVTNSQFHGNVAYNGGNMMVVFDSYSATVLCTLTIKDSIFQDGNAAYNGGGLYIHYERTGQMQTNVHVYNSSFSFNSAKDTGGGVSVSFKQVNFLVEFNFIVSHCHFSYNFAKYYGGGVSFITEVQQTSLRIPYFAATFTNCTFIKNEAQIHGGGLLYELMGSGYSNVLKITHCTFTNNNAKLGGGLTYSSNDNLHKSIDVFDSHFQGNEASEDGGHIELSMHYQSKETNNSIAIRRCSFLYGSSRRGGAISGILQCGSSNICSAVIKIEISEVINNTAELGGGIYITEIKGQEQAAASIEVKLLYMIFVGNNATLGGAVLVDGSNNRSKIDGLSVLILNSSLSDNYALTAGAGLSVTLDNHHARTSIRPHLVVELKGNQFTNNKAGTGSAVSVTCGDSMEAGLLIRDTKFCNHMNSEANYDTAVVYLENVSDCQITRSLFLQNIGSNILANQSNVSFQGDVIFTDSIANTGAAIHLECSDSLQPSFLTFFPNASVVISNNTALHYGGGIAVNPECDYNNLCFFQVASFQGNNSTVSMLRNTAHIAGSSIYGRSVDYCTVLETNITGHDMFLHLFSIDGLLYDQLVMFSQVYTVCFCSKDPTRKLQCSTNLELSARPGEEFNISAIVTRPLSDATTYHFVRASLSVGVGFQGSLGTRQSIQELRRPCQDLTYSIMTSALSSAQLQLIAEFTPKTYPASITVKILPCPLGFELDDELKCDCSQYLSSKIAEITCDINSMTLSSPGEVWIGNTSSNILAAHPHCPFDYCIQKYHSIDLQNQDQQCKSNHAGVLCGSCAAGFSLALGSAKCLKNCSNYHIFLILPFAVAGVLLVILLFKCNLTVSKGTINELIFYSNVVHINRTTFFPQDKSNFVTQFLTVFIAWINLDLGIETCFYRGMTAYVNAWLQFVFPFYIWALVLIIICSFRYFRVVEHNGSNAVSVLATLFLLSYAKLLRTVILIISPINIEDEQGNDNLLWRMNANMPYLVGPHVALFLMALLATILYIIPLTLLTLLAPYLQAGSHHQLLRWVIKIKPFLDTFQGPYKDKFRYWTGGILLLRIILFMVFATATHADPNVFLLTLSLSMLLLFVFHAFMGQPYASRLNRLLGAFYNFNLGIFATTTLFLHHFHGNPKHQEYLADITVGCAFAVFCFILAWHLRTEVKVMRKVEDSLKSILRRCRECKSQEVDEQIPLPPQVELTQTVVDFSALREPLLDSEN